jgi:predicted acylesterase/phospholipase RssA
VSNLPVEAALAQGATEIIALDLSDARGLAPDARGWLPLLGKIRNMAERRQLELELALAEARGVPVRHVMLQSEQPIEVWDFSHADELIERGYQITREQVARWQAARSPSWLKRLLRIS